MQPTQCTSLPWWPPAGVLVHSSPTLAGRNARLVSLCTSLAGRSTRTLRTLCASCQCLPKPQATHLGALDVLEHGEGRPGGVSVHDDAILKGDDLASPLGAQCHLYIRVDGSSQIRRAWAICNAWAPLDMRRGPGAGSADEHRTGKKLTQKHWVASLALPS